jgi:dCMP deaminase
MHVLFAYVPVLHRGYEEFFAKYAGSDLYLLSREELLVFEELEYLKKDIRVLSVDKAVSAIKSWNIFNIVKSIKISEIDEILYSLKTGAYAVESVVLTDDDVGHFMAKTLVTSQLSPVFEPIFLRWDKNLLSEKQTPPIGVAISRTDFEATIMQQAFVQAGLSSDWWRHVGSVLVKDDQVLLKSHNLHLPMADQQYKNSDPRISFTSGVGGEFSSSIHAEAALIAEAARRGIAVEWSELYVTTFPCPVCAKQIAAAGIKKLYYAKGYAVLDGLEILQTAGVEIVLIDFHAEELHELEKLEQERSRVKDCYVL